MITRRELLQRSIAVAGASALAPAILQRTAEAREAPDDSTPSAAQSGEKILVVVQMSGGNDGLNTVVPWADDLYHKARPTLRIDPKDVLKLDDRAGLHPSMKALRARFDKGEVAVVQGVGYPRANRSHSRSMAIWHSADPVDRTPRTGWLGRAADALDLPSGSANMVVNLGTSVPFALRRQRTPVMAFDNEDSFAITPDKKFPGGRAAQMEAFRKLCEANTSLANASDGDSYAEVVRATAASGLAGADRVMECLARGKNEVPYPKGLGQKLSLIARMISGGMSTRIYYASFGSFDTHARQKDAHANLLSSFADGVDAFFQDVAKLGRDKDVLLVSFSEFGRRLAENGSAGTDHGTAAPMLVIGPSVRGGVHGKPPDLEHLVDQDPLFAIDFRAVYATLLESWLKVPAAPIVGGELERLAFLPPA